MNELYDNEVPQSAIDQAWNRSRHDVVQQRRDRAKRQNALPLSQILADREQKNAEQAETRANWSQERVEEDSRYMATYHQNRINAMTPAERDEHRKKNKESQAKSRAKKKAQKKKAQSSGRLDVPGSTATTAITTDDMVVSRLKKKAHGKGRLNVSGSTVATAIVLDDTIVSPTASVNTASKIPFVDRTITAPRRRFMPSTSLKGKAYPVISSSESEPESESESESLNGFIVDDDVDD